jgi:hypothetical protein
MKEYCTAATRDAGQNVVIDLDDEIVEVIVASEPVSAVIVVEF